MFGQASRPCLGGENEAKIALGKYETYLNHIKSIKFDAKSKVYEKGNLFKDWTWLGSTRSRVVLKDGRWRYRVRHASRNYVDGVATGFDDEIESLLDGDGNYFVVDRDYREARARKGNLNESDALERLDKEGGEFEGAAVVELESKSTRAQMGYAAQNEINMVFGYMPFDNQGLPALMREGRLSVRPQPEVIEGHQTVTVESVGPHGLFTLCLDPGLDYAPRRIGNDKKLSDKMGDTVLKDMKAPGNDHDRRPNLALRGLAFRVDFRYGGGKTFPAGFERIDELIYEKNVKYYFKMITDMGKVDPEPTAADLERTLEIRDGTPLVIRNAPGIKAKWEKGKIIQEYDQTVVAKLKDINFAALPSTKAGGATSWKPLIVINVFVVSLIAYLVIRKRRKPA